MTEREQGFNEAIDRVLFHLMEQARSYAKLYKESTDRKMKIGFHYKALAMVDFKLLMEDLFQTQVTVGDICKETTTSS